MTGETSIGLLEPAPLFRWKSSVYRIRSRICKKRRADRKHALHAASKRIANMDQLPKDERNAYANDMRIELPVEWK